MEERKEIELQSSSSRRNDKKHVAPVTKKRNLAHAQRRGETLSSLKRRIKGAAPK